MPWQDIVLMTGSILFSVALIPTVLSKDKPPISSSLLTGIVLAVFAFVYGSLALWYSMATTSLVSFLWLLIAYQKWQQPR